VTLWLVTWTTPDGYPIGSAIVEAPTFLDALDRCAALGIMPGGESQGDPLTCAVGPQWRDRLLTPEECKALMEES